MAKPCLGNKFASHIKAVQSAWNLFRF